MPSGHTDVYLESNDTDAGSIYVLLDSPTGTPVATLSGSSSITSTATGITFHDSSTAYQKQGATLTFTTGGSSTLEIDTGANDAEVDISSSDAATTAKSTDFADSTTGTDTYNGGITALHVVLNDAGAAFLDCTSCAENLTVDTGSGTEDTIDLGGLHSEGSVAGAVINTGAGDDAVNLAADGDDDSIVTATIDFGNNPGAGNSLSLSGGPVVTATLAVPQAIDSVSVSDATLKLDQSGRWNTNTFGTIDIEADGVIDLGAQDLLVTGMADADVRGMIVSAYNGNTWTGSGITSSYAIDDPSDYAVGYATYSDGISGLGLSSGQVLVRPTRVGDADLNGTTQLNDYNLLAANYNHTGTDWAQGDFNYDGTTGLADYNVLASNFNDSFPT